MKLSHGDSVIVTAGKDKGKKGTIMRVLHASNRVIVSGVNMVTKHVKKTAQSEGKKMKYEVSMSASNVMILDPKTGKPSRIGYKVVGGKKVRFAKKSGTALTRVKGEADKKGAPVPADSGKKSPFWKKTGFGADAVQTDAALPTEDQSTPSVPLHRSGGRGS